MKRHSPLKRHKGLKRTPFVRKVYKPLKRTKLRVAGHPTVSEQKREIQALLREIVILRDGGCILRDVPDYLFGQPPCNGYRKDGELILQADHLISRENSATYADSRLVVCVCKGHHGWKSVGNNIRKKQYDTIVRKLLTEDRTKLWDKCEQDSWRPVRTGAHDWKLCIIALTRELKELNG